MQFLGSAPPSRSCSRADVRLAAEVVGATVVVGGNNWARHRAASAPSTPLPTPPVSPHHWPRRSPQLHVHGYLHEFFSMISNL